MIESANAEILPNGWVLTALGRVIDVRNGYAFKSADYQPEGVLLLRQANLGDGKVSLKKAVFLPSAFLSNYQEYLVTKGDVVIGMSGSIGKLCVYDLRTPALQNQRTGVIQVFEPDTKSFIRHFFSTLERLFSAKAKGVVVQNISAKDIKACPLPLPPLAEQKRIVAKIERLVSDLDAGVAALETVKKQIRRYRQAVLKHAFEGKLTAEWRKKNKDKLEPSSKLLERIAKEREKNARGKKQKKLPPLDTSQLPKLPDGWCYLKIDALLSVERTGLKTGPFGTLLKKYEHKAEGVPVLGIENIGEMQFKPGNKIFITQQKAQQLSGYRVIPGDIIISRSGTVGEICVVPNSMKDARISTNLMRISLNETIMSSKFLGYMFRGSPLVLNQVSELSKGSTRDFLNQRILKTIIFPVPSLSEQEVVIQEIERHFSVADEVEQTVEKGLKQAQRLRQSILKRAFEGKLVEQDPNDEPAEKLLERIKAEKAK